jgi:predicted TIM-barrel fold metal-dependent hydrolase
MPVIDADAHVVESNHTWDYMAPDEQRYRPRVVTPEGEGGPQLWMIDGKIRGLGRPISPAGVLAERARKAGRPMVTPPESQQMEDVGARLRHMDELGIEIQVLYPSIFIEQVADRPEVEVPICRSYNRWLADIWQQSNGRLPWACALPLLDMDEALAELDFCKEHGACAVNMRPLEGDRLLPDPYFFPLYQKASDLDLAIGVHIGNANPVMSDIFLSAGRAVGLGGGFWHRHLSNVGAFFTVVASRLPERFPHLRMGFIESAAGWLPFVLSELSRRTQEQGNPLPERILRDWRLFITTQMNEDLPYLLSHAGEDNLLLGTDYGHRDTSTELDALQQLRKSRDISSDAARKILEDNPQAFYGL